MSYDVKLEGEDGQPVKVERHSEGGTCAVVSIVNGVAVPGTDSAELNVTWNYSWIYRDHFHPAGLSWIHGKKAKDVTEVLEKAVKELGTKRDEDYWAKTKGNAGYALSILLKWAKKYPEATFMVY